MLPIARSLLLSVPLAAILLLPTSTAQSKTQPTQLVPTNTPPANSDPCTRLAQLADGAITWQDVATCYNGIPFHAENAKATIDSLYAFYRDVYVFTDSALTPDLARPFSSPRVDILATLQAVGGGQYQREIDFHSRLEVGIASLNDAHASYMVECFQSYIFQQPLVLYSSYENGRQAIRVLEDVDSRKPSYVGCEVLAIDGQNPFTYVQSWADTSLAYSKDPGVRFNQALGGTTYDPKNTVWRYDPGSFAVRLSLPPRGNVSYRLSCPNNPQQINYSPEWRPSKTTLYMPFTDSASFYQTCLRSNRPAKKRRGVDVAGTEDDDGSIMHELHSRLPHEFSKRARLSLVRRQDTAPPPANNNKPFFPGAQLVFNSPSVAFFQLITKPQVGIVVLPTMDVDIKNEASFTMQGLSTLASLGVTNIILDVRGNGGGYVLYKSQLVQMFFPATSIIQFSQLIDVRVTPAARTLADADYMNRTESTLYEPMAIVDAKTLLPGAPSIFDTPLTITRNGHASQYTAPFYQFNPTYNITARFPWTGDASKIKILTDGRCGSSCGLLVDLFVNRHGVEAYAIGGYNGQPLSMFSFAGGSVLSIDDLLKDYADLGVQPPMQPLPLAGTYGIPYAEAYSQDDTIPLEYNPARHPAKYRLDYNERLVHNPDELWNTVSTAAWNV